MAASVALAVSAALTASSASVNAALDPASLDRITIYRSMIPGIPSNRYYVIFAGNPARGSSGLNVIGNDGVGRFQVTCAATAPDTNKAADICDRMVKGALDALVGAQLTVDGWSPFIVEQDEIDTFPIPVEVVPGRDTVEQALWFTFLTDRIS